MKFCFYTFLHNLITIRSEVLTPPDSIETSSVHTTSEQHNYQHHIHCQQAVCRCMHQTTNECTMINLPWKGRSVIFKLVLCSFYVRYSILKKHTISEVCAALYCSSTQHKNFISYAKFRRRVLYDSVTVTPANNYSTGCA